MKINSMKKWVEQEAEEGSNAKVGSGGARCPRERCPTRSPASTLQLRTQPGLHITPHLQ